MAEWYNKTTSQDGVERITVKLEKRLTIKELAALIAVSAYAPTDADKTEDWALATIRSRGDAVGLAKDVLHAISLEEAKEQINEDKVLQRCCDLIEERLNKLW